MRIFTGVKKAAQEISQLPLLYLKKYWIIALTVVNATGVSLVYALTMDDLTTSNASTKELAGRKESCLCC